MSRYRWKWLLTLVIVNLLYIPLNRRIGFSDSGIELMIGWDKLMPVWPVWVVPYFLSILYWYGSGWVFGRGLVEIEFRRYVFSMVMVMLVSFCLYALWPTYVERPVVEESGVFGTWLKWVYSHDNNYNAFPSSHVYFTVVTSYFWWKLVKGKGWLWVLIVGVVAASTVLTGQHHLLDPVAGLLLGLSVCLMSSKIIGRGGYESVNR